MKFPASQALHAYWSSLCRGRRAPERSELDPVAMRDLLAQTFILDVDCDREQERDMPIRLSGTRLDALFDIDLKGSAFVELWAADDRALLRTIAADVLEDATPALIGGLAGPRGIAANLGFEILLLPLRHQGRTHARLLGGLALAATPTWMGLRGAEPLTIGSWRMMTATAGRHVVIPTDRRERRAHLTVYEGGRSPLAARHLVAATSR